MMPHAFDIFDYFCWFLYTSIICHHLITCFMVSPYKRDIIPSTTNENKMLVSYLLYKECVLPDTILG